MKSEIKYSETGLCPKYNLDSTAKDIPNNDTTNPYFGFLNLLNNAILFETQIKIIDLIEVEDLNIKS